MLQCHLFEKWTYRRSVFYDRNSIIGVTVILVTGTSTLSPTKCLWYPSPTSMEPAHDFTMHCYVSFFTFLSEEQSFLPIIYYTVYSAKLSMIQYCTHTISRFAIKLKILLSVIHTSSVRNKGLCRKKKSTPQR